MISRIRHRCNKAFAFWHSGIGNRIDQLKIELEETKIYKLKVHPKSFTYERLNFREAVLEVKISFWEVIYSWKT